MNKYQKEALNYLNGGCLFGGLSNEALEVVEELINKEIPVKPNYIDSDNFCSQCNFKVTIMGSWNMNYCGHCGQKYIGVIKMNKYKKALAKVRDDCFWSQHDKGYEHITLKTFKNLDLLQEVVNKETPMKPNNIHDDFMMSFRGREFQAGDCYNCNGYVISDHEYCGNCGQK